MTMLKKGLLLAAIQCAIVLTLSGKLLYDRQTCPRVWVKTAPWDPTLPIRGRYLALRLAPEAGTPYFAETDQQRVLYFVPEKLTEFERQQPRPELWAEVTIPHSGPPRPIRLGIMRNGTVQPLHIN